MQQSDIGKVVHYSRDENTCVPGVITKIYPDSSNVDLVVLQSDLELVSKFVQVAKQEITYEYTMDPATYLGIFTPDQARLAGSWHNPEPVS